MESSLKIEYLVLRLNSRSHSIVVLNDMGVNHKLRNLKEGGGGKQKITNGGGGQQKITFFFNGTFIRFNKSSTNILSLTHSNTDSPLASKHILRNKLYKSSRTH